MACWVVTCSYALYILSSSWQGVSATRLLLLIAKYQILQPSPLQLLVFLCRFDLLH